MGQKIQKSPGQKKIMKSNESISRKKFFSPNSIFLQFQKWSKINFELEKSLKLPKMQFHEKKTDLFDFTSEFFLPG